ncbi:unnamed protein product [Trifolium pratense]|uniref:Uncharacterized protein n=1 Tax=Trifolium pratense TaxID=57577 RepID=A0ACB0JWQ7_TRIPR|nr:unnamed protein product [Trifolium pratense]
MLEWQFVVHTVNVKLIPIVQKIRRPRRVQKRHKEENGLLFRGAEPINKCESDADCEEFTGVWYMKCIDQKCV